MALLTDKDKKWMKLCEYGAELFSTCGKRQYFACIVDAKGHVLGTGYNGGPAGLRHCVDGGCQRFKEGTPSGSSYDNCIAIHAEANALLHSDYTARMHGGTIYVNGPPCYSCAKLIANSGIKRVVYKADDNYVDWIATRSLFKSLKIEMVRVNASE